MLGEKACLEVVESSDMEMVVVLDRAATLDLEELVVGSVAEALVGRAGLSRSRRLCKRSSSNDSPACVTFHDGNQQRLDR
ncbi:MAG: hypothetical protein SGPRY_000038 [Prymnesium sp.]